MPTDLPFRRYAQVAAWCTLALGLIALGGWWLEIGWMRSLHPSWRAMSPNSALAFVLSGVSLLLLQNPRSRLIWVFAQLLAGCILVFSIAAILRLGFQIETGVLAGPIHLSAMGDTARLPVGTTLPSLLVSLGLLALAHERKPWFGIANWLGLAVMSFALLSLVGAAAPETRELTRMSVASSLGFTALGFALLSARIDGEFLRVFSFKHPLGDLALSLLAIGLIMPLILYFLVVRWLLPVAPQLHDTGVLLAAICSTLVFGLLTLALRRMDILNQLRNAAEGSRDLMLGRMQQQAATLELLVSERTHELRKTTERLDFALRAGGFGVWDWDLTTKRVFWDSRQCAIYAYSPEQFNGTTGAWLERIHPNDREPLHAELEQALSSMEDFDAQFRIVLPDGSERHIASHGVIRRDSAHRAVRVVGMDRDVTEEYARERELAALNDRLQLAIKATGYGVWEMDPVTRQMIWDDRMLEIYGLERENFNGAVTNWQDSVLPEDVIPDEKRFEDAIAGKSPIYQSTFRIRRPDGSLRYIEALGVLQTKRGGGSARMVGLDRDITEATELREELRITEERWQLALKGTNDGIWDWDLVRDHTFRDLRYAQMIGYQPDELPPGRVWLELGHPDDVPGVEGAIADHLEGRASIYQCEYRLRHRDGRWIWVLDRGKIVARDASGRAQRMVGTQTDITQRKELEERLRHGEELSLQLSRLAQIGGWEWDLSSAQLSWSPEMFRIHEVELGFEPTLDKSFGFYPPEARRRLTEAMEHAVRAGAGFDLELPFTTGRGHPLWVRVLGRAQLKDGRATRVYGAFQDITGRRDAEEMRRQLEGQLFQAQKMETLGTLAGGIAHDFNNLLTGILGYQDLALDTLPEEDPARAYLSASREASLRARELVDQILTFSRQADSEKMPVNLAQIIEDARRFLRATVPATIRIEVDTTAECGSVLADATQIHQVLLNLGSNAAHALGITGGTMRMKLTQVELDAEQASALNEIEPGSYARLDFSDNGHGMDEDTRKRIFDPFFTTKEVGQGTGLGLSVVHGIIQAHRGTVVLESTLGVGSTFSLYFAIADVTASEPVLPPTYCPRGNGELIAVVDDEDIVRSFAQMALEKNGYRVASFDSPAQCLEVLRRNAGDYRVLLTDQTMPVMKGIELATEIRTFAPDLPVVVMSGYFSRISPEMLAAIGHISLLSKPFTNDELARVVARAMNPESTSSNSLLGGAGR